MVDEKMACAVRAAARNFLKATGHKSLLRTWAYAYRLFAKTPQVTAQDYVVVLCPLCGIQYTGLSDLYGGHKHLTVTVSLRSAATLKVPVLRRLLDTGMERHLSDLLVSEALA